MYKLCSWLLVTKHMQFSLLHVFVCTNGDHDYMYSSTNDTHDYMYWIITHDYMHWNINDTHDYMYWSTNDTHDYMYWSITHGYMYLGTNGTRDDMYLSTSGAHGDISILLHVIYKYYLFIINAYWGYCLSQIVPTEWNMAVSFGQCLISIVQGCFIPNTFTFRYLMSKTQMSSF